MPEFLEAPKRVKANAQSVSGRWPYLEPMVILVPDYPAADVKDE